MRIDPTRQLSVAFSILLIVPALAITTGEPLAQGCDEGVWETLAPMMLERQETGATRIGGKVYVMGGIVPGPRNTTSVEVYDIASNQWTAGTPIPQKLDHQGVAALNGLIYVVGGSPGDGSPTTVFYIYHPGSDTWTTGPPLPEARVAGWVVGHAGKLYYFGGVGPAGYSRTTYIYDPTANAWSTGADMPTAREHLSAVSFEAFLYVIGGRGQFGNTNVNERYNPVTNTWVTLLPLPTARSGMGMAVLAGKIVAVGGESPVFAINEVYDIGANTWECRAPMAVPRHGIAAVAIDDRVLFPGGGTVAGIEPSRVVDSFVDPPASVGGMPIGPYGLSSAPNPFSQRTELRYQLGAAAFVTVEIHDLRGALVRTLLERELQPAGRNLIAWDGRGSSGDRMKAGVYWAHVDAGSGILAGKLLLLP